MSDWQKGDLALCICDQPSLRGDFCPARRGCFYTVGNVFEHPEGLGLTLEGINHPSYAGFHASRFLKVTPPKDMKLEPLEIEVQA